MSRIYQRKEFWYARSPIETCLICGGRVEYRPPTVGVADSPQSDGIETRGLLCCWPCTRTLANMLQPSEEMERLTTSIMLDFKSSMDEHDDPDGYAFLQQYSRFSQIPASPMIDQFTARGGTITPEDNRRWWTQLIGNKSQPIRSATIPCDIAPGFCFQPDVRDQYNVMSVMGASGGAGGVGRARYSGVSTRRCGGLRMGPGGWGGSGR